LKSHDFGYGPRQLSAKAVKAIIVILAFPPIDARIFIPQAGRSPGLPLCALLISAIPIEMIDCSDGALCAVSPARIVAESQHGEYKTHGKCYDMGSLRQ
jgi:hypothetical protein